MFNVYAHIWKHSDILYLYSGNTFAGPNDPKPDQCSRGNTYSLPGFVVDIQMSKNTGGYQMLLTLRGPASFLLVLLFVGGVLTSCSSVKSALFFWRSSNNFEDLKIVVGLEANQNSAIALDLVFAYDNTLIGQLEKINARTWFKDKDNYRLNFPMGFDVVSWGLVPGQVAPRKPYPSHRKAATGIFIFANYSTPKGVHRARVDQLKYFEINLGKLDFTIKSL
jgi:type VI secretion system protein